MECYTCGNDVTLTHHVKLRGDVHPSWGSGPPPSPEAWRQYQEETTYRSAFICRPCYGTLDSVDGVGEISGKVFNIAGQSRSGKAPVYNVDRYEAFQRAQAKRLGLPEL